MKIIKKPKSLGMWLSMKMISLDLEDAYTSDKIKVSLATLQHWKSNSHPPKLVYIFRMIKLFSDEITKNRESEIEEFGSTEIVCESPAEIMDELLESIHEYRQINKEYRVKKQLGKINDK